MKYIKPYLITEGTFSDSDFEKIFNYFVDEVYTKKEDINSIIEDAFESLGFLKIIKNRWNTSSSLVDNPYYGARKSGGSAGLSYEFMNMMNQNQKDIDKVKGWNHAWYSVYNDYLQPKNWFGEIEHEYPYYEYKINIKYTKII